MGAWHHSTVAICRDDVALTIAWGADQDPGDREGTRRTFDWDEHIMGSNNASGLWGDVVRYRVSTFAHRFGRLVHNFEHQENEYDNMVHRVRFEVVD